MAEPLGVLLVSSDERMLRALVGPLESHGYAVESATTGDHALGAVGRMEPLPAVGILDLHLPDMDGFDLARSLRETSTFMEIVFVAEHPSLESAVRALRERSFDFFTKPVESEALIDAVDRAGARSQRRAADAALRESERQLRRIFQATGDALFVTDGEGRILDANPAALTLTGQTLDELEARSLGELLAAAAGLRGEAPPPIVEARDGAIGEYFLLGGQGRTLLVEVRTAALTETRFVHTARDQTERRRMEEQVHRADRMEVVGRLAGGLAHDFNNVLTAIAGYAELLAADLQEDPNAAEGLQEILQASRRAGKLTKELLAFSRRQVFQPRMLDPNSVLSDVEHTLRRVARGDVEFVVVLGPELGPIRADKGQLEQVLVNLVVNASDAMPDGGRLTLTTSEVEMDEAATSALPFEMIPGRYIAISVSDTGTGMDEDTVGRIFEPFFTTKELGMGTGLGLATAYGIVKQSGGFIHAESTLGEGTRFTVYLPRFDLEDEAVAAADEEQATGPRGGETILLAEDDRTVRTFMRRALELRGYSIFEAASAPEALDFIRTYGGPIHLMVTDLLVPGAPHHGLAAELAQLRPETPVILSTGHEREATDRGDLRGMAGILDKPFTIEDLHREVRRVLDRS